MSYQISKPITLCPSTRRYQYRQLFSGGYVDNALPTDLLPFFSPYMRNGRVDGYAMAIRPGHDLFASLTPGSYPKGISTYLRSDPSLDKLIVRHNQSSDHKLVLIDQAGTITSIDTNSDITADTRMHFQNIADKVYCMNGVDPMGFLDGTTYALVDPTPLASPIVFSAGPSSSNDMFVVTNGTGSHTWKVQIDSTGIVDTFEWQVDGGAFTTGVPCVGPTMLAFGLSITFNSLSGHTMGESWTWSTAPFTPKFSVVFNGSMWVSGWSSNPNTVYQSVNGDYVNFTGAGSNTFTFSEHVTGLASTNEALFYFTESTVSSTALNDLTTDSNGLTAYTNRAMEVEQGAVNYANIVTVGNDMFYVTPQNTILQSTRGSNVYGFEVNQLSHRPFEGIDGIMNSLDPDQSESFGYFVPQFNLVKWFFKTQGATFNDICVVYDIEKDLFMIDTQKYFFDGTPWGVNNYTVSMIEAKVFQDEYSQADENTPIPFEYRTKQFWISDPTYKKIIWECRTALSINELASVTQEIWSDQGLVDTFTIGRNNYLDSVSPAPIVGGIGTYPIGTSPIGEEGYIGSDPYSETYILRTKGDLNYKARWFQWRFTNNTLAGLVKLQTVAPMMEILPGEATNLSIPN